jgi:hypothetical protein
VVDLTKKISQRERKESSRVRPDSIEEVILERHKDMSSEEHSKCKNILNDQKIYD